LTNPKKPGCQCLGFCPDESTHHFLVTIPASNREEVLISEHFTWDEISAAMPPTFAVGEPEGKLRVLLPRVKWDAIADDVRVEFNQRLKRDGRKSGSWKTGTNPVSRLLGKELVLTRVGHRGGGSRTHRDGHQELARPGPRGALVALHHDLRGHRACHPGAQ